MKRIIFVSIILQTMNPVFDIEGNKTERANLHKYIQVYNEIARKRNLLFIDHYTKRENMRKTNDAAFRKLIPDGVHPQEEGYRKILLPELKKSLTGLNG